MNYKRLSKLFITRSNYGINKGNVFKVLNSQERLNQINYENIRYDVTIVVGCA